MRYNLCESICLLNFPRILAPVQPHSDPHRLFKPKSVEPADDAHVAVAQLHGRLPGISSCRYAAGGRYGKRLV